MKLSSVYFIGIGGISLSGMAKFLKTRGLEVAGSDRTKSEITKNLEEIGIKVNYVQRAKNMEKFDVVVYTDAVSENDKELEWAKKLGKKVFGRADFLKIISKSFRQTIAVAGCHGKTTTTGMLHFALSKLNPTTHVGGMINGNNFFVGENKLFITEACEYKKNLLKLKPFVSVILNIGLDHVDCYKNIDEVTQTFQKFADKTEKNGFVLVNGDDENCKKIVHKNKYTFGLSKSNNFYARNIKEQIDSLELDFYAFGKKVRKIKLSIGLFHNVYNALASLGVAYLLNVQSAYENISKFKGVSRRNELVRRNGNVKIFHDYAHHPEEIGKIISEHKKFCKGRLIVVFEAHTYSRTKALIEQFKSCFALADKLFILPIYAAREKKIKGISGKFLAKACGGEFVSSYKKCAKKIKCEMKENDEVLILGAGSVYKLSQLF